MERITLDRPIPLHTYTKEASNDEQLTFEDVVLTVIEGNMVQVQSNDQTRMLIVLPDGRCVFDGEKEEKFEVVEFPEYSCLRSTTTGFLLQFNDGAFHCLLNNDESPGIIVFRNGSDMGSIMQVHPLIWCLGVGVAGATMVPMIGLGAAALAPTAMYTAGGVVAILQSTSAALMTTNAAAAGAAVGTMLGLYTREAGATETQNEEEEIDFNGAETQGHETESNAYNSQTVAELNSLNDSNQS